MHMFMKPSKDVIAPPPPGIWRFIISDKRCLSDDVVALYLKPACNTRLQYRAGQYVEFILPNMERRAFSIANASGADGYIEFHIKLMPGGVFADYMSRVLVEGADVDVVGPLGEFYLREHNQRPIVMVGGGTGFSPLKAMIEHANNVGLNQPVHLYIGGKTRNDLYMMNDIASWKPKLEFTFTPVVSDPAELEEWTGEVGFVHDAVLRHFENLSGFDIYVCGPQAMIQSAVEDFLERGADKDCIYQA